MRFVVSFIIAVSAIGWQTRAKETQEKRHYNNDPNLTSQITFGDGITRSWETERSPKTAGPTGSLTLRSINSHDPRNTDSSGFKAAMGGYENEPDHSSSDPDRWKTSSSIIGSGVSVSGGSATPISPGSHISDTYNSKQMTGIIGGSYDPNMYVSEAQRAYGGAGSTDIRGVSIGSPRSPSNYDDSAQDPALRRGYYGIVESDESTLQSDGENEGFTDNELEDDEYDQNELQTDDLPLGHSANGEMRHYGGKDNRYGRSDVGDLIGGDRKFRDASGNVVGSSKKREYEGDDSSGINSQTDDLSLGHSANGEMLHYAKDDRFGKSEVGGLLNPGVADPDMYKTSNGVYGSSQSKSPLSSTSFRGKRHLDDENDANKNEINPFAKKPKIPYN